MKTCSAQLFHPGFGTVSVVYQAKSEEARNRLFTLSTQDDITDNEIEVHPTGSTCACWPRVNLVTIQCGVEQAMALCASRL